MRMRRGKTGSGPGLAPPARQMRRPCATRCCVCGVLIARSPTSCPRQSLIEGAVFFPSVSINIIVIFECHHPCVPARVPPGHPLC